MTITNHLSSILNNGQTEKFDLLTEYINNSSLSLRRYRDITKASKTASVDEINALVSGIINSSQFIQGQSDKPDNPRSFDEIYSEIKDINCTYKTHLRNTADLFNKGVCYLEEIIQRVLSDEYINTFDESDENSREVIKDGLDRINQIHNVISSLM